MAAIVGNMAVVSTIILRIEMTIAKKPEAYTKIPNSEFKAPESRPQQAVNAPKKADAKITPQVPPARYASPMKVADLVVVLLTPAISSKVTLIPSGFPGHIARGI